MENRNLLIAVAVLAVAALLVPMMLSKQKSAPTPPAPPPVTPAPTPAPPDPSHPAPPSVPPAKPPIDAGILNKMLYGMTYEDVVALVGTDADESESEFQRDKSGYTAPTLTVWKTWLNPDGSKLRIGFVEGKLEQKQFKRKGQGNDPGGGNKEAVVLGDTGRATTLPQKPEFRN